MGALNTPLDRNHVTSAESYKVLLGRNDPHGISLMRIELQLLERLLVPYVRCRFFGYFINPKLSKAVHKVDGGPYSCLSDKRRGGSLGDAGPDIGVTALEVHRVLKYALTHRWLLLLGLAFVVSQFRRAALQVSFSFAAPCLSDAVA